MQIAGRKGLQKEEKGPKGLARDGTRWPSGARSHPSQSVQVVGKEIYRRASAAPRLGLMRWSEHDQTKVRAERRAGGGDDGGATWSFCAGEGEGAAKCVICDCG